VKGLGAAKVTSLVDAFTKPFLVGGLKRDRDETGETSNGARKARETGEPGVRAALDIAAEKTGVMGDGRDEDDDALNGHDQREQEEAEEQNAGAVSRNKRKAGDDAAEPDVDEHPGGIGSPEWPSEEDDVDPAEEESGEPEAVSRGRERVPSRSPGISPELRSVGAASGPEEAGAWRDPLEDDDVDDNRGD
jgi:DNA excision repair protein ERCC-1